MGRKIFVSYKYGDNDVHPLAWVNPRQGLTILGGYRPTTVRHYVDELQGLLEADDHINKGEADGEDLSHFKDSTIASRLRSKIHDSSITIVMISPNMKEYYTPESDQWIPWEISYSLKEHSRNGRTSKSNALLAVVLPNRSNSYSYFIENRTCCSAGCRLLKTDSLFQILAKNMFNVRTPSYMDCRTNGIIYQGHYSYIHTVTWADFKASPNMHLGIATEINDSVHNYNLVKTAN